MHKFCGFCRFLIPPQILGFFIYLFNLCGFEFQTQQLIIDAGNLVAASDSNVMVVVLFRLIGVIMFSMDDFVVYVLIDSQRC
jgi:hypothetical protein